MENEDGVCPDCVPTFKAYVGLTSPPEPYLLICKHYNQND